MRARGRVLAMFAAAGVAYFGYPYVTLYRLEMAVRQADAATLGSLVDWYAVREGLKEDICDMVLDEPADARPANELPPFGAGFVRGVTANAVEQNFTPETLVSMTRQADDAPHSDAHVEWAFFESPTRFFVNVRADGADTPIRVMLELRGVHWRVRRVWLPNAILEMASAQP